MASRTLTVTTKNNAPIVESEVYSGNDQIEWRNPPDSNEYIAVNWVNAPEGRFPSGYNFGTAVQYILDNADDGEYKYTVTYPADPIKDGPQVEGWIIIRSVTDR